MTESNKLQSEFLNEYLEMNEETESPRLFHIWAALGGMGATLGRRVALPFGPFNMFPNMYTLMVGTPGTRKSAALSIIKKILRESTNVRFAPGDTSGHRQGLAKAMQIQGEMEDANKDVAETFAGVGMIGLMGADAKGPVETVMSNLTAEADRHVLTAITGEFSQFVGQSQLQMLDFLTQMWDGDDYDYQTKAGSVTLDDPLLNIIGCTTPVSIASSMPPAAGGQGFLSRVILVYGAGKYKSIPRPPNPPQRLVERTHQRFSRAYQLAGPARETPEARKLCDDLYEYACEIEDPRFVYYKERRHTHLIKTALALMAARGTTQLIQEDYIEAHAILRATERGMADALGEFGLSPLAALKQGILELLRSLAIPIPQENLMSHFHREARQKDIVEAINDLILANLLHSRQDDKGKMLLTAIRKIKKEDKANDIIEFLAEK